MSIDISVFCPAIRTNNWKKMYDSLSESCKMHSFELVLCSPFDLPEELKDISNIKLVKDYGSPSRCAQLAYFECEGRLIYHVVDDALFFPDAIDEAIKQYEEFNDPKTIINMKYREGQNYSGGSMRADYWMAWGHDGLRLAGIPRDYKISLHHMMSNKYFGLLGGYDCEYEYQNFNLHDFIFRAQYDGAKVFDSVSDVTTCDHSQLDHRVIEDAHSQHDAPLFNKTYGNVNALKDRTRIDINNWTQQPPIWTRRFKNGIPKEYSELVRDNNK